MANIKFSQFTTQTDPANVQFVVGFNGTTNVKIAPGDIGGGGGATDLNGLSDVTIQPTSQSAYFISIPSGLISGASGNLTIGKEALNNLTTGNYNTAIGFAALNLSTTSSNSTAVGYNAGAAAGTNLQLNTVLIGDNAGFGRSGYRTVAVGSGAMSFGSGKTAVNRNTAIGYHALYRIDTNGADNIALGHEASQFLTTATENIAIGDNAARSSTSNGHISIGYQSGYSQTSAADNTNIGYQAGYSGTTAAYRTIVGFQAGYGNTGAQNVFVGQRSGTGTGTGANNVAVGSNTLRGNNAGSNNAVLGHQALIYTTGGNNTAVGYKAGDSITTGSNNTVIGYDADASSTTVSNEITLGDANITSFRIPGIQSGASDGDVLTFNQFAGKLELQAAGGGGASDLNGLSDCLVASTSTYISSVPSSVGATSGNTVVGQSAGNALGSGAGSNTFIGQNSSAAKTSGINNVTIGAGSNFLASSGSSITAVGAYSANNVSGNNGVYIGYAAGAGATTTGANCIVIGNFSSSSSTTVSNEITLGDSNITSLRCAVTSITSLSDERDKSEIKDLGYGLAFIDALQPREFVWDNRPETRTEFDDEGNETEVEFYSANKGKKDFGFIAQEVKELDNDTLRLVYSEDEEKLELSYGKLVPVLVQAIKELKAEIELLKS